MKTKNCFLMVLAVALLIFSESVFAKGAMVLEPLHQDFFTGVMYRSTDSGLDTVSKWLSPPVAKSRSKIERKIYRPIMPGAEKTKYFNTFEILSPATLTENNIGGGGTLNIKTDGISNTLSMIVNDTMLISAGYYKFDVSTHAPGVDSTNSLNVVSISLRNKLPMLMSDFDGEVEYRVLENSLDTTHYAAVTMTKSVISGISATIGGGYVSSDIGGSEGGIIASARYKLSPSVNLFANYNAADPLKHIYNNHLLALADSSLGTVTCNDCPAESFNAGVLFRLGSNLALNIYGYDLSDLAIPAGSLMYIVKE